MVLTLKFVPNRLLDHEEKISRATNEVLKRELIVSVKKAAYLKYERKPSSTTTLVTSQNRLPALLSALSVIIAVKYVSTVVSRRRVKKNPPAR